MDKVEGRVQNTVSGVKDTLHAQRQVTPAVPSDACAPWPAASTGHNRRAATITAAMNGNTPLVRIRSPILVRAHSTLSTPSHEITPSPETNSAPACADRPTMRRVRTGLCHSTNLVSGARVLLRGKRLFWTGENADKLGEVGVPKTAETVSLERSRS
jgi:hypothetical protein